MVGGGKKMRLSNNWSVVEDLVVEVYGFVGIWWQHSQVDVFNRCHNAAHHVSSVPKSVMASHIRLDDSMENGWSTGALRCCVCRHVIISELVDFVMVFNCAVEETRKLKLALVQMDLQGN